MVTAQSSFPIGIMCALPEESRELINELINPQPVFSGQQTFTYGQMEGYPVFFSLSGMGKVNAAITAQKLISEFKVKAIIFCGVAGGINSAFEIGDILIANRTFQHDIGFLGSEFVLHPPGVMPEVGIGKVDDSVFIELDHYNGVHFSAWVRKLADHVSHLKPVSVNGLNRQPRIKVGVIATGDQFIANADKKLALLTLGADAVEMEGGSVAQVCKHSGIPLMIIRTISDKAGELSHVDFSSFLPILAANHSVLVSHAIRNF